MLCTTTIRHDLNSKSYFPEIPRLPRVHPGYHECTQVTMSAPRLPRAHPQVTASTPPGYRERTPRLPRAHPQVTTSAPPGYHECTPRLPRVHPQVTASAPPGYRERTKVTASAPRLPRAHQGYRERTKVTASAPRLPQAHQGYRKCTQLPYNYEVHQGGGSVLSGKTSCRVGWVPRRSASHLVPGTVFIHILLTK